MVEQVQISALVINSQQFVNLHSLMCVRISNGGVRLFNLFTVR